MENIAHSNIYGIKTYATLTLFKKLRLNYSFDISYQEIKQDVYQNNDISYNSSVSTELTLPKDISLYFSFLYPGKNFYLQGYNIDQWCFDYIAIGKSILNNNGSLFFVVTYPYSKDIIIEYEDFDNYTSTLQTNINFRMFRVLFAYYFQRGKEVKSLDRKYNMEKDK